MAEAAEAAEKQTQLINIGLNHHHPIYHFSSDIRKWNGKPEDEKTWPTFETHFKEAQREIKCSQPAITTDFLGFHGHAKNAAAIVDQVIERLSAEQQMQQEIQQEMTNATQQESVMQQIQSLMSTISDLQT